jgi:hypothetical protein
VPFRAGASGNRTTAITINGAMPAGLQRSPALIAVGDEARDRRVDRRGHDAGGGYLRGDPCRVGSPGDRTVVVDYFFGGCVSNLVDQVTRGVCRAPIGASATSATATWYPAPRKIRPTKSHPMSAGTALARCSAHSSLTACRIS